MKNFGIFEVNYNCHPRMEMYQKGQVYIGDAPANDSTKSLVLASTLKARKVAMSYEEEVERNKRFTSMVRCSGL